MSLNVLLKLKDAMQEMLGADPTGYLIHFCVHHFEKTLEDFTEKYESDQADRETAKQGQVEEQEKLFSAAEALDDATKQALIIKLTGVSGNGIANDVTGG